MSLKRIDLGRDSSGHPLCKHPGCGRTEAGRRGYCAPCYHRERNAGRLRPLTHLDRFMTHVERGNGDCWLWAGTKVDGYGRFRCAGKLVMAHRWIWEHSRGPIPDGYEVDHLCRNPACVNPDHLEPVTPTENHRRTRQETCNRGHDRSPANVYIRPSDGARVCRPCLAEWERKNRRKVAP